MWGQTKYITYESHDGNHLIAVFPYGINHADMEITLRRHGGFYVPLGAGFVVDGKCEGESISMKLKSRPVEDTKILKAVLGK